EATSTIPVVGLGIVGGDLIEAGLAASLARPGGNVTGLTTYDPDLIGKRLQLLTESAPGISRVAVIWAGSTPFARELYARAAQVLGVDLQVLEVHSGDELQHAFEVLDQ